tara:strand:- start:4951 stop:6342 length:1392 start_codon:yes stop_codon:yes gene_type:complete
MMIGIWLMQACKVNEDNLQVKSQQLPENYPVADTDGTGQPSQWKEYFKDPALLALIDTALINNYDRLQMLQRIEMSHADLIAAKGNLAPTVDAVVNGSAQHMAEYSADWAGNEGAVYADGSPMRRTIPDYFLGFEAAWEADIRGKLRNEKKAAFSRYLSSVEGTHFVTTNLVAEVAYEYYQLLALDQELEFVEKMLANQEEALEVIQYNMEAGKANQLAVQQFEAQVISSKAQTRRTAQRILETENRLNYLLGRFPQEISRSSDYVLLADSLAVGSPNDLLKNRPDIREAELMLEASKFDTKAAKAAFYPSLSIGAGVGFQAFNPEFLFRSPTSIAYGLVGQLAAPLINRSAIKAQFEFAKANQVDAIYNYQETVLNGYMEVYNQLTNLQNLQEVVVLKNAQSATLEASIETSKELYRTGKASYLEVLVAQENTLSTQMELIDVQLQEMLTKVNLYRALGGGW